MKVLVTGGCGFLGARIAARLASRGDRVTVFDAVAPATAVPAGAAVVTGDITDAEAVAEAVGGGIDAVVHCAAVVGVPASVRDPLRCVSVNVAGSVVLLEAMRRAGVRRLVHLSSNEVYGDASATPIAEDHPLRPQLPYGVTKLAVEQLCRDYGALYGIASVSLRGSWIYAPDFPRPRLPNLLIDRLCRGEAVRFETGADSVMDYVHADDVTAAVAAALDRDRHRFDAYNIGAGVGTPLPELAALAAELIPGARVSVGPGRYRLDGGLEMRVQGALDIGRAARELGWRPERDLRTGLEELIRAAGGKGGAGPPPG